MKDNPSSPVTVEQPQLGPDFVLKEARELLKFYESHDPPKPYTAGVLADCIDQIERLRRPAQCASWQPIETAPKDFTVLLLYQPAGPGHAEGVGQGHRTDLREHAHDKWVFQAAPPAAQTGMREFDRLLDAIKRIVDRHAESKEGSGLLYIPAAPYEMKELRSAIEPFRALASSAGADRGKVTRPERGGDE